MDRKVENKKIVVGMSGGVDSSMALVLLKEAGWEPIGVSLKLPVWESKDNLLRENVCCTDESFAVAKSICEKLGVPFYTVDAKKEFRDEVIKYFNKEYASGRTPNPCSICNRELKFGDLFEFAEKVGAEYVSTGHYAKTRFNPKTKKYELLKAKDKTKDQTYALSLLPQKWISKIVFPLGEYTKDEVFEKAKKLGLKYFTKQKESQDFCFVAGKSLPKYLKEVIGEKDGDIVDTKGKVLGKHEGLHFYTIGQRKGIELSGGPYFVKELNTKKNQLVVTKNEKDLFSREAKLEKVNYISGERPKNPVIVTAKVRYQSPLAKATLTPQKGDRAKIVFEKPQRAITPGQTCVFYTNEICFGGGIIRSF